MGYPKRITDGFFDCRPKIYRHRKHFQEPSRTCNNKCIYSIFCKMEFNKPTIGDRIKEIRLVLQRPWVAWGYLENDRTIIMMLEGPNVQRLMFRGEGTKKGIIDAIESAEKYIEHERKMGSLRLKEEEIDENSTKAIEEKENINI